MVDHAHGREQLAVGGALDDVTCATSGEHRAHVSRLVVHGEDEHARLRRAPDDLLDGLDTARPRHADVHQRNVGLELLGEIGGLVTVDRLADHFHVGLAVEQHAQTAA
jgi:hypothetical protein